MIESSHEPCPKCNDLPCDLCNGEKNENVFDIRLKEIQILADQAVNNLKFLNLGFSLGYYMTDLERKVYYYHQIKKYTFKEISKALKKSEGSIRHTWHRCKLKGDSALKDSIV